MTDQRFSVVPSVSFPSGECPYEHPLVAPQLSHFSHEPLRTMVICPHSLHELPV